MARISLKAARVAAGMTQKELAEKLGVSRESIVNWETGNTPMKIVYLYAFCHVTGFSEDDIILPEMST